MEHNNYNCLNNQINKLTELALRHRNHLEIIEKDIANNNSSIIKYETELAKLNEHNKNLQLAKNYLDALIKQNSDIFIKSLNEILNYGVKTIFYDCDYSINIDINDNKANLYLMYYDENGNKIAPDIQQCGGGIQTVVGILLQIFFIVNYELEPILFVDEGFSQVSSQYLPSLFSVIQEVINKNGLKMLLVTHDTRILQYADKRYEIQNGIAVNLENSEIYNDV